MAESYVSPSWLPINTCRSCGQDHPPTKLPTNDGEEWRQVKGYPDYAVSSHARLIRLTYGSGTKPGKILKGCINPEGYLQYSLSNKNGAAVFLSHRLVAITFLGPPPSPHHFAAHWDDNKSNNHLSNIRWASPAQNIADALRNNRIHTGTRRSNAKLTPDLIHKAFHRFHAGETIVALAAELGVGTSTLGAALRGETWRHIDRPRHSSSSTT